MPESHVNVGISCVIFPIRDSISNHKSFEVWLKYSIISSVLCVVLIDVVSEVRHVDSGVGFTGYKELVRQIFWVFNIPLLEGSERILRLKHIVGLQVLSSSGMGVAYTSW